jgi:hypothetical protein
MNRSPRRTSRLLAPLLGSAYLAFLAIVHITSAQTAVSEQIVVSGAEVPSAYGAPPAMSRSRFSNLTNAYVLPPWAVYAGIIYEGDALRFNSPDHMFTQEIEIGLPYRFGVAMENSVERFLGHTQDRSFSLEVRYALADWNKIPLNPTFFAEYKFGLGHILHDEGPPAPLGPGVAEAFINQHKPLPDAYELRLLLSQDFSEKVEWALNAFFEQEIGGDRGREYGFAQSVMIPIFARRPEVTARPGGKGVAESSLPANEILKVGFEMQLTLFNDSGIRNEPDATNIGESARFVIGPTIAWKPTRNTRLDVSPLFGMTHDAPRVSVFVVFSMLFGPPGAHEVEQGEAPVSTRNR